jgi:hypothetical protein
MTATGTSLCGELAAMAALLAFGMAPNGMVPHLLQTLRDGGLSAADTELMERGYYETLREAGRRIDELPRSRRPHRAVAPDEPFDAGPLTMTVSDVREFVLKPELRARLRGRSWSTNSFGLRDREYARQKPPDTFRVAFVGDSIGAGWGVDDGEGFEPRLERALDERSRSVGGPRVEILNFAVPGHAPGQRWEDFTRACGWGMAPDLVLYEATLADSGWDERRLRGLLARGVGADARVYRDALRKAGAVPYRDADAQKRRLRPFRKEILAGVYRTVAQDCRDHNVPCVWVLVPRVGRAPEPSETHQLLELAKRAGFSAVFDLSDAYSGIDAEVLAIGPADFHPNLEGHVRLARRLEQALGGLLQ